MARAFGWVLILVPALLLPAGAWAQGEIPSDLVGIWTFEKKFEYGGGIAQEYAFAADGRYAWAQNASGDVNSSLGRWRVEGGKLVIQEHYHKPEGGPYSIGNPSGSPMAIDMQHSGDTLTLRGDLFVALDQDGTGVRFVKTPGSEETVAQALRDSDELHRKNDEEWRQKVTFAKLEGEAPDFIADPRVPRDPAPGKIFEQPTVFAAPQTYSYIDVTREHVVRNDPEDGRTSVRFYFFPNGRVFAKFVLYPLTGPAPGEPEQAIQVQVTTAWGRYHIAAENDVKIESDAGETFTLSLVDGRRNLLGLSTGLTQSEWLVEILEGRAR